jgi:hypothetical protein
LGSDEYDFAYEDDYTYDPGKIDFNNRNVNDVPFTVPGNYDFDNTRIEISAGTAKLLTGGGDSTDWDLTTPAEYTYDSDEIEVSGGAVRLRDQIAKYMSDNGATFFANYDTDIDGTWGIDSLTGTGTGSPVITGGKLDLTGAIPRNVWYDGGNSDATQTGCIRFKWTPDYSGTPPLPVMYLFEIGDLANPNNRIAMSTSQTLGGSLYIFYNNFDSSIAVTHNQGAFTAVSGREYEIEFNFDFTTGAIRLFIDGVQFGATRTETLTRNAVNDRIVVGSTRSLTIGQDCFMNDFQLFNTVQHTADYAPNGPIPVVPYLTTDPMIYPVTGFAFYPSPEEFTATQTVPALTGIGYQVSVDAGATWLYYSGGMWGPSNGSYAQSNTAAEVAANINSLAVSGNFKWRAVLHSDDGTATPEIDNIYFLETIYPVGDFDIEMLDDIQPTQNLEYTDLTETVTTPVDTSVTYQYSLDGGTIYNGIWLTFSELETEIKALTTVGDGTDKIRFKFRLNTSDSDETPEIDILSIETRKDGSPYLIDPGTNGEIICPARPITGTVIRFPTITPDDTILRGDPVGAGNWAISYSYQFSVSNGVGWGVNTPDYDDDVWIVYTGSDADKDDLRSFYFDENDDNRIRIKIIITCDSWVSPEPHVYEFQLTYESAFPGLPDPEITEVSNEGEGAWNFDNPNGFTIPESILMEISDGGYFRLKEGETADSVEFPVLIPDKVINWHYITVEGENVTDSNALIFFQFTNDGGENWGIKSPMYNDGQFMLWSSLFRKMLVDYFKPLGNGLDGIRLTVQIIGGPPDGPIISEVGVHYQSFSTSPVPVYSPIFTDAYKVSDLYGGPERLPYEKINLTVIKSAETHLTNKLAERGIDYLDIKDDPKYRPSLELAANYACLCVLSKSGEIASYADSVYSETVGGMGRTRQPLTSISHGRKLAAADYCGLFDEMIVAIYKLFHATPGSAFKGRIMPQRSNEWLSDAQRRNSRSYGWSFWRVR